MHEHKFQSPISNTIISVILFVFNSLSYLPSQSNGIEYFQRLELILK